MTPIGTVGDGVAARAQRRRPRARTAARAARSSSTPVTNGNMMRSGPCTAARSSARSCAWKISSNDRLRRMPRRPSGARAPSTAGVLEPQLRLADVERADRDAAGRHALDQPAVGRVLRLFGRAPPWPAPASRNSDRNRPMPSAPRSRARAASSGSSTLASSRICDAVLGDGGSARYSSSDCS